MGLVRLVMREGLKLRNLVEPSLVTASVERRGQKSPHDGLNGFGRGGSSPDREDVGVVVLSGEASGLFIPGEGSTNAWDLVGGDLHADPAAADQNASVGLSTGDGPGHLFGKVWIVDRVFTGRAQILDDDAETAEKRFDRFFALVTSVITGNQ